MSTDTRTESERRYDATALSQRTYAQPEAPAEAEDTDAIIRVLEGLCRPEAPAVDLGPFGTDVTDEMIAALEVYEQGPSTDYSQLIKVLEAIDPHLDYSKLTTPVDAPEAPSMQEAADHYRELARLADQVIAMHFDPIGALRAEIDATEDYATRRRLIFRLADLVLGTAETEAPAVRVERFVCDDDLDARCGTEIATEYSCGETFLHLPDDGSQPTLFVFGHSAWPLDILRRDLPAVIKLLGDERVQAAWTAYEASQQRKAA